MIGLGKETGDAILTLRALKDNTVLIAKLRSSVVTVRRNERLGISSSEFLGVIRFGASLPERASKVEYRYFKCSSQVTT